LFSGKKFKPLSLTGGLMLTIRQHRITPEPYNPAPRPRGFSSLSEYFSKYAKNKFCLLPAVHTQVNNAAYSQNTHKTGKVGNAVGCVLYYIYLMQKNKYILYHKIRSNYE